MYIAQCTHLNLDIIPISSETSSLYFDSVIFKRISIFSFKLEKFILFFRFLVKRTCIRFNKAVILMSVPIFSGRNKCFIDTYFQIRNRFSLVRILKKIIYNHHIFLCQLYLFSKSYENLPDQLFFSIVTIHKKSLSSWIIETTGFWNNPFLYKCLKLTLGYTCKCIFLQ